MYKQIRKRQIYISPVYEVKFGERGSKFRKKLIEFIPPKKFIYANSSINFITQTNFNGWQNSIIFNVFLSEGALVKFWKFVSLRKFNGFYLHKFSFRNLQIIDTFWKYKKFVSIFSEFWAKNKPFSCFLSPIWKIQIASQNRPITPKR